MPAHKRLPSTSPMSTKLLSDQWCNGYLSENATGTVYTATATDPDAVQL